MACVGLTWVRERSASPSTSSSRSLSATSLDMEGRGDQGPGDWGTSGKMGQRTRTRGCLVTGKPETNLCSMFGISEMKRQTSSVVHCLALVMMVSTG